MSGYFLSLHPAFSLHMWYYIHMRGKYWELFISTFRISSSTFGGGFVIVPLLKKRFVDELGWIEEEEMLDLVAISQSSPGPIAVNASVLIGYKALGLYGALVAILGTVLPPLIIISIISSFYKAFRDSRAVSLLMAGMISGVAAVLADVAIRLSKGVLKKKRIIEIAVLVLSFVLIRWFKVNILLIIASCFVLGGVLSLRKGAR